MIDELIAKVFEARNCAHLAHWNTSSCAAHVALGEFYEGVIPLIDSLVETHSGLHGKIGRVTVGALTAKACAPMLKEHADWIGKNRARICGSVTALESIVDEIAALYLKTLYKLKELS